MKKTSLALALLTIAVLLTAGANAQTDASPVKNTIWKAWLDQLNDSIALHITDDSSFVTTSNGDTVVRSVCKMSADTLLLSDYDGQYACTGITGKYKVSFDNDVMTTALIEDACEGRAGSINNLKWRKSQPATK
ncbi:MAG TPA: hypothetical protein VKU83_01130 [Puia sp.]|nr:hypothetical protein [Puia sp.]